MIMWGHDHGHGQRLAHYAYVRKLVWILEDQANLGPNCRRTYELPIRQARWHVVQYLWKG